MKPLTFGQQIQRLRLQKRAESPDPKAWSGKACARRAGMEPQQWSDIENDRSRSRSGVPSYRRETLEAVARGLDEPLQTVTEMYYPQPPTGTTLHVLEKDQPPVAIGSGQPLTAEMGEVILRQQAEILEALRKLMEERE